MPLRPSAIMLLAAALPLAGCELITGEKARNGESVGYACRVSNKTPEDCMKENTDYSPSSILDGWKVADKDVRDKKVDTQFNKPAAPAAAEGETPPAEGEAAPPAESPAPAEATTTPTS